MKNIKTIAVGVILLLAFYFICSTVTEKNTDKNVNQEAQTVGASESKDYIIFGRYGSLKGVYTASSYMKKGSAIVEGKYDMLEAAGDRLFFNYWTYVSDFQYGKNFLDNFEESETKDKCLGIYTSTIDNSSVKCIAKNYTMSAKPAINNSGDVIVFFGERKDDKTEKCIDFGVYTLKNDDEPVKLQIKCSGREDVDDISFCGDKEIVYTKKVYSNGTYTNQVFRYNFDLGKEECITSGKRNYLSLTVSPDGKKLAYLEFSQIKGIYGVFVTDINDTSKLIFSDLNDAVVGDSLKWSPDSSKILYIVLADNLQNGKLVSGNVIKVADLNMNTMDYVDNGYIGAFSPDGSSIVYADYKIEITGDKESKKPDYKCTEVIAKRKIGDLKHVIAQFEEESLYSESINELYWYK